MDNKREEIRVHKEIYPNKPRFGVSVDQIQSDQPILVPQLSGKLTSALICYAQVIVDHFSNLSYVHLTRIKNQEDNLSGKAAFEIWAATFGVKINRYHVENGLFSEQHFI